MASPEPTTPFDDVVPLASLDAPTQSLTEVEPAPQVDDGMSMVACIRRFIAVSSRLDDIAAEEKVLAAEKSQLSERVIELMIEGEWDSPPGVDGMTMYLVPVHYVKKNIDPDTGEAFTSDDIRNALVAAGHKGMIKQSYNGNQLRALLTEIIERGDELPTALAKVVTLEKRRDLAAMPMSARKQSAAPRAKR